MKFFIEMRPGAEDGAWLVACLPSRHKVLGSNPKPHEVGMVGQGTPVVLTREIEEGRSRV